MLNIDIFDTVNSFDVAVSLHVIADFFFNTLHTILTFRLFITLSGRASSGIIVMQTNVITFLKSPRATSGQLQKDVASYLPYCPSLKKKAFLFFKQKLSKEVCL